MSKPHHHVPLTGSGQIELEFFDPTDSGDFTYMIEPSVPASHFTKSASLMDDQKSIKHPTERLQQSAPRVLWSWKWEILALLAGLGVFVAMLVILLKQNNCGTDEWVFLLNLNSLIALLSTIYRAVLVAVAAEVVSQSKWVYFWSSTSPLPLLRLQYFDRASRSIWGAIRLFPYVAKRSPAALAAALILVVSFGVGPFMQQSIGTIARDFVVEDGVAKIPVTRNIDGNDTYYRTLDGLVYGMWDFKYNVRASILSALSNPNSNDSAIIPICSSGNCTFPSWDSGLPTRTDREVTHVTAGMCSRCFDVGSLITVFNDTSSPPVWKLPNDVNVTAFDRANWLTIASTGNLTWANSVIPLEQAAIYRWAFANVTVLSLSFSGQDADEKEGYPETPRALVCPIYPCLRSYSASVSNGRLMENLINTQPMYPDAMNNTGSSFAFGEGPFPEAGVTPGEEQHIAAIQSPCLVNGIVYTTANFSSYLNATDARILSPDTAPDYPPTKVPQQCLFKVNTFFYMMLSSYLQKFVFDGVCSWDTRQGLSINCKDSYWLAQFWELTLATEDTITNRFSSFAEAATRQFRLGLARDETLENNVSGTAMRTKPYTVIDLKWLIFPITLLAIETVVLVWMIGRSLWFKNSEMVWKSNVLPFLYHREKFITQFPAMSYLGSEPSEQRRGRNLMTIAEMETDASKTRVTLARCNEERRNSSDGVHNEFLRRRHWDQDSLLGA